MKKNLLSISQLTMPSKYVVFGPEDVKICKDVEITGAPTLEGQKMESIYTMSTESAYVDKT